MRREACFRYCFFEKKVLDTVAQHSFSLAESVFVHVPQEISLGESPPPPPPPRSPWAQLRTWRHRLPGTFVIFLSVPPPWNSCPSMFATFAVLT